MTPLVVALLVLGAALILAGGLPYLMAARLCLMYAVEEVRSHIVEPAQLDSGELQLLTLLDGEFLALGFQPLGFGAVNSPITYQEGPTPVRVLHHEHLPAFAFVRYRDRPEPGYLVEVGISSYLSSGEEWITANTSSQAALLPSPAGVRVEEYPGSSVAALVARHAERVGAVAPGGFERHDSLRVALERLAKDWGSLRSMFRERGWTAGSADPSLDRFTLRGAFALAYEAVKRQRRMVVLRPLPAVADSLPIMSDALLIEADLHSLLRVAEHPRTAPGTHWPLLGLLVAGVALSFAAMALVFDPLYAVLVLLTLALHEGGHALAMRAVGYRNVRIFFIPLFGAITVGRPANATVRGRLAVLLAGPMPGMWLGALLLAFLPHEHPMPPHLTAFIVVLLFLNGLNLLPLTPLDGGRVLEVLTRPESIWRPVFHVCSALGLLALYVYFQDVVFLVLGVGWVLLVRSQWQRYLLLKRVAAAVQDRKDFRGVARTVLEVVSRPPYGRLPSGKRQGTARAVARVFGESVATGADRVWGAVAYASAWAPVVIALLLMSMR